jgi:hypothetical protein
MRQSSHRHVLIPNRMLAREQDLRQDPTIGLFTAATTAQGCGLTSREATHQFRLKVLVNRHRGQTPDLLFQSDETLTRPRMTSCVLLHASGEQPHALHLEPS